MDPQDLFYGDGSFGPRPYQWMMNLYKILADYTEEEKCEYFPCYLAPGFEPEHWYHELPNSLKTNWDELNQVFVWRWMTGPEFAGIQCTVAPRADRFQLYTSPPISTFIYTLPQPTRDELQLREVDTEIERERVEVLDRLLIGIVEEARARRKKLIEEAEDRARLVEFWLCAEETARQARVWSQECEGRRQEERLARIEALVRRFEEEAAAEEARRCQEAEDRRRLKEMERMVDDARTREQEVERRLADEDQVAKIEMKRQEEFDALLKKLTEWEETTRANYVVDERVRAFDERQGVLWLEHLVRYWEDED